MPLPQLIQRVSSYMHAYTLYSSVRPFGVTAMIGTWSKVNILYFIFSVLDICCEILFSGQGS